MKLRFLTVLSGLLLLTLQGCSSNKILKGYEGDELPAESIGVVIAPDNISLVSINGKQVPQYLLSSLNSKYGLKPGPNKLVFMYESVWGNSKASSKGEKRSITVSSDKMFTEIDVQAGQTYRFSYIRPENVREAQALVADPKFSLYDSQDNVAALAEVFDAAKHDTSNKLAAIELLSKAAAASTPAQTDSSASSEKSKAEAESSALPKPVYKVARIDQLKTLWQELNAKEKKDFLVWAFQE